MNRIVRHHYPAGKLPDDLREGIDPSVDVRVTVETEEKALRPSMTLDEIMALRRPPFLTAEEIDAMIRHGRDDD